MKLIKNKVGLLKLVEELGNVSQACKIFGYSQDSQIAISTDTKPIQDIMKKGIKDMILTAACQPKNIVRKFQILLFPEQDAKLFYKIVFGRWLLWLVVMLFLTNLYKFSIHWSDNQKEIKQQQLENDRIKKT